MEVYNWLRESWNCSVSLPSRLSGDYLDDIVHFLKSQLLERKQLGKGAKGGEERRGGISQWAAGPTQREAMRVQSEASV